MKSDVINKERNEKRSKYFTIKLVSEINYRTLNLEEIREKVLEHSKKEHARIYVDNILVFLEKDIISYGTIGDGNRFREAFKFKRKNYKGEDEFYYDFSDERFDLTIRKETDEEVSQRRYDYFSIKVNRKENYKFLTKEYVEKNFKKYAKNKNVRLVFVSNSGRHENTFFIENGKCSNANLNGDLTLFWDYICESLCDDSFELCDDFFNFVVDE